MSDRTVHGYADGKNGRIDVVRYNRAGKWYLEEPGDRIHVGVGEAARFVVEEGGFAHIGRPGGSVFDRRVLQLRGLA